MPSEIWKAYPHIWKNKVAFFTWLRGCLRRCWNKSPLKIEVLKNKRIRMDNGKGRIVWGAVCSMCGGSFPQNQIQVDHVVPAGSLQDVSDIEGFVTRLLMSDDLRLVCKGCNAALAYADKHNISYEEALTQKKVIAIINDKKDKKVLEEAGIKPASNAKARRKQLEELFKGGV